MTDKCIYCGDRGRLTRDHIPPKCLFPKPRPSDLITVPCCETCNGSFSSDDEYFRTVAVLGDYVQNHIAAEELLPTISRSLARPGRSKPLQRLIDSVQVGDLARDGVRRPSFESEREITSRVGRRITRGLYYHVRGTPLALNAQLKAGFSWSFRGSDTEDLYEELLRQPINDIAGGVFTYRYLFDGYPNSSAWMYTFYMNRTMLALTSPS
jgi:hypothetical protein